MGVRDAVRSLNWLNGCDLFGDYPGEPDNMQQGVIEAAQGLVQLQQRGADAPPSSRAALDELLRGRAIYGCGEAGNSLAPYQQGRVSLPDSVAGSPAVEEVCGALGQFFLAGDGERMRRSVDDAQRTLKYKSIRVYSDPNLVKYRRRYKTFVKDLLGRGLLTIVGDVIEQVGIFFVWKKGRSGCG